jgi:acid phosphatase (class A)
MRSPHGNNVKTMRHRFCSGILAVLLSLPAVHAAGLHYLSPDAIRIAELLPDPPAADSFEQRCELAEVQHIHSIRTPADLARAKGEDKFTVFAFADVLGLGPDFTAEHDPKTAALFAAVESDAKYFEKQGKHFWNRPRPPIADSSLKPDKEQSYPSGHSTRSMAMGEILEEIFPDRKQAIESRAQQIGWDRVILGVHYPSDIQAGRTLGHAISRALLANPKFRSDLAAVQHELSPTH